MDPTHLNPRSSLCNREDGSCEKVSFHVPVEEIVISGQVGEPRHVI